MFPLDLENLTPEQRVMVTPWEKHLAAEFRDRDTQLRTRKQDAIVNASGKAPRQR
jgi:hypothetical protein